MHYQLCLSTLAISIFTYFLTIFFLIPLSYSQDDENFAQCFDSFSCGDIHNLMFPFSKDDRSLLCRQDGFVLSKCEDPQPIIHIGGNEYRLMYLNHSTSTMSIVRNDLWEQSCLPNPINITINDSFLTYPPTNRHLTLFYNCSNVPQRPIIFPCSPELLSFYADDLSERDTYRDFSNSCGTNIQVQVNQSSFDELQNERNEYMLEEWRFGFNVVYDFPSIFCERCDNLVEKCSNLVNSPRYPVCKSGRHGSNLAKKLAIGFGAAAGGIIISAIAFYFWLRHRRGKEFFKSSYAWSKSFSDRSFMMDPEKVKSLAGVHLFTYKELGEATNNFDSNKELGDGGFGTVYYGKLRDGRAVAIKRLYENNYKRVEQFMNEVWILTKLHHRNLVSLYGCTSRHSRELLLVYEYVSNGTVADHLHGQRAKPGALSWSIRLDIAIETADALSYLHASKTIHRDVKTNNILLDNNFTVKVADFGLSRLFPSNVTHVSTAPQGTPGYVDPEYHQCYQLTEKSDVFSFGVVLVELISSKPAVDITRHRHEINLSNMAINKIQNRALHELVDPSLGFESDYKVRKMITGVAEVAFQCLQNEKEMRPTMARVLEALKGIQNEDYNKAKAEEMDISADDVGLLKSGPLPHSPDSVMTKWHSSSTIQSNSTS
ncbi:LEAF RUST 10 DISEASE-RESISTANCE LOCUS RECEPTOR-LIKE PROTEIN KINASE-like 1.2 isoform X2 [Gossypium raimondii]|uniref:LEAF RUST 10 DISEASE-RESISTANCE LOCUS RECEPTOR-LIKE PROTEIN KINASE-like 1.2 isoform X2 n=2 Tax=Gossypium raimondii TaxID=29730 RepID=UPI00063AE1C1|nr:LEAF RUST 10 DISEASE-RESISTANCE LOCUS RECEPTOR-LIKE PROTEIN KINASE-like 1.2 isoform X2 [Gossypium raimondii]